MRVGWAHIRYAAGLAVACGIVGTYAYERDLRSLYHESRESQERINALDRDLDRLRQQEQRLRQQVDALGNDPVEMEAAIRRSKHLVRPGEKVFRVELDSDAEPAGSPEAGAARQGGQNEPDTRDPAQ